MCGRSVEINEVLIDEASLQKRVGEMGLTITRDYQGKSPLFVCVLRGAAIFHADLIRKVDVNLLVDFISVCSYGDETASSGAVQLIKDLEMGIEDRNVLLVEDIVDTGHTLSYLVHTLKGRNPASIRTCALSRKDRAQLDVPIDYLGFEIPDVWVVGYGLDYADRHRTLPFVAELKPEVYS